VTFLFAFTYLFCFLQLIPKNTKITLQLLLLIFQTCEPIPSVLVSLINISYRKVILLFPYNCGLSRYFSDNVTGEHSDFGKLFANVT
jgi:hypothetical protein